MVIDLEDAIRERRSIRSFKPKQVPYSKLKKLVKAACLAPSSRNQQPLEFLVVDNEQLVVELFEHSHWAGNVDWKLDKKQRPRAYILIVVNKEIKSENYQHDVGLAAENICLQAVAEGLATCLLGSIEREPVRELLNVPQTRLIDLAIAVGYPAQEAVAEEKDKQSSTGYWRDKQGTFHVPKRRLEKIIYRDKYPRNF